jgi:hypothetical protein
MAEASLKLGTDWAVKEDYLLGYNDENGNYKPIPFDFSRASIGTRVNRDGLIEEVQDNIPRIDFSDGEGSLLLEPQRTNNITYSEDMSNAFWSLAVLGTGVAPIVTANYATSPDGTQSASRIQFDRGTGTTTNNFSLLTSSSIAPSSGDFVVTFYAKTLSGTSANLLCYLAGTTTGVGEVVTLNNEWQRFSISATASSNGSVLFGTRAGSGFYYTGGDQTLDVAIWGVQKEAGSYSTSLIPTSGSAVTRVADVCDNAQTTFNDSEGVLYAEFKNEDTTNYKLISISDGTDGNRIFLGTRLTTGYIYYFVVSGGSTQASYITTDLASDFTKVAVKYKANDFALWINGTEVSTDSSGSTPTGLDLLQFNGGSGTLDFHGNCKELRVYNTALSDTELQELTTL